MFNLYRFHQLCLQEDGSHNCMCILGRNKPGHMKTSHLKGFEFKIVDSDQATIYFHKVAYNMTLPWVVSLKSIIDADMPINQKATQALDLLKGCGMAYVAKLKAREMLVHPSNRGGAMINAFDVVSKGEKISQVGWDMKKISTAVCVELPYEPLKRKTVLDANTNLAEQSGGLLAKPFGQERFQTLSLSHTTCFLRSLEAGCKLGNDRLSIEQMVSQGDDFGKMLHDGWEWVVIAAKVEEEVPSLPGLLQQSLNSNLPNFSSPSMFWFSVGCWNNLACVSGEHSISRAPNELEVAMTIAHYYQLQPKHVKNLERAVQQAASSMPPCHKYIKSIGDFVQSFAGGESFQLLKYLDFISFLVACVFFESIMPLQAHFSQCRLFSANTGLFQPMQAFFSQYRLVSANKGFFQPVQAHVWEQWFIPLLQLRPTVWWLSDVWARLFRAFGLL